MQTVAPRHHTPRSDRPTLGHGVAAIAKAKGRPLMPWQRQAVDVALEVDPTTGLLWYGLVIVTVQRQAGKTTLESDVADHRCLTRPNARVWYTAQTGKDASAWMRDEHFAALARAPIFGRPGAPDARYTLSKRAGQEGVNWNHGSTFRVFPPLRDALHGKQADLVFIDEAWALSVQQGADVRQAVRPTMATRPGSQLWPVSTQGDDSSLFWETYYDLGVRSLDDPTSRVCIIDYGLRDDDDPEDLTVIARRHPAHGHTIGMDALVDARNDFGADAAGWARAYGNRPTRSRISAFHPSEWAAAAQPRQPKPDRYGLALDATPDGRRIAITVAWRTDTGHGYIEPLYVGAPNPDTARILAQLSRAAATPLVVDRASYGALEITDAVTKHDPTIDIRFLTLAEYASACTVFRRGIADHTVHHPNDGDLDAAVDVATTRTLSDGSVVWGRKHSTGSIAELVSATIALRAADTLPATPRKPVAVAGTTY